MSKLQQPIHSLKKRVIGASTWVLAGYVMSQALRLGSNLIMTRLLVPEMFGVMALANVLIVGVSLISDIGLNQNIIQSKRGDDAAFLNTAWTLQIARGGMICLLTLSLSLMLFIANQSKWFAVDLAYANPVLPYVIAVLSFLPLISGFNSTKIATANRNLAVGPLIRIELLSQILAIILMVIWALFDRSIWALVIGACVGGTLKMIFSHKLLPGKTNRLCWDYDVFKEIFHFGKWIFISSILGFLAANGDRLLLGGVLDSATLGLYAIAFFVVNAIQQIAQKITGSVTFPALSEVVRKRPEALKRVYYKFRLPIDVVLLFTTGFLFSTGHLLIEMLYDERYHAAGYMLDILCISLMQVRYSVAGQCFMAMGKPKLLTPLLLVRVISLFSLTPIAFNLWGLEGALWVIGGSVLFPLPLALYYKVKYGLFDLKRELLVLPFLLLGYLLGYLINAYF